MIISEAKRGAQDHHSEGEQGLMGNGLHRAGAAVSLSASQEEEEREKQASLS